MNADRDEIAIKALNVVRAYVVALKESKGKGAKAFVVLLYLLVIAFSFWKVACVLIVLPVSVVERVLLKDAFVFKKCSAIVSKVARWKF